MQKRIHDSEEELGTWECFEEEMGRNAVMKL